MDSIEARLDVLVDPVDLTPAKKSRKTEKEFTPERELTAKEKAEAATEALRLKMREKVKGIFHFYECPQGMMPFIYKEFKKDPLEKFELVDGQIYELPLGVALHLNRSGKYPVHKYSKDPEGKVAMKEDHMISRYGFESLEFKDINREINTNKLY